MMASLLRLTRNSLPALAALLMLVCGCSRPSLVPGREEMARLVADLELTSAYVEDQGMRSAAGDSMRLAIRSSVLAKHGVNEAQLDSSFRWYGRHLPEYIKVIERADSILADSLRAIDSEESLAATSAAGDSLELWTGDVSAVFARNMPSDILTFEIPLDDTWQRGDVVTLSLAVHNSLSPLKATIGVDYANRARTIETVTDALEPGDVTRLEVKLQLDSLTNAERVFGFIRLRPAEGERALVDSIRLTRTRLVPNEYNRLRRLQRRLNRYDD